MRPLGLYVHWPFCARICPYCDFTVAKNKEIDEKAWTDILVSDLRRMARWTEKRPLQSIYFGGGTPSLMPLSVAEAVLQEAEDLFGTAHECERTIEANPDDLELFADWRAAGFARLSLGLQSFDDDELRFLGRNHDGDKSRAALSLALSLFPEVSYDLIYALPGQNGAVWKQSLTDALARGGNHLSLYQLTIEQGTAFGRAAERGTLVPTPDERAADLYDLTQDITAAAGLPAYEVSNHARAGHEAVHNALYWQDADWIAIGPGSHGRTGPLEARRASEASTDIRTYTSLQQDDRIALTELSRQEAALEAISGGLRPARGLDLSRLGSFAAPVAVEAEPLVEQGFLFQTEGRIAATRQGRLVLDHIASRLAEAVFSSSSSV